MPGMKGFMPGRRAKRAKAGPRARRAQAHLKRARRSKRMAERHAKRAIVHAVRFAALKKRGRRRGGGGGGLNLGGLISGALGALGGLI